MAKYPLKIASRDVAESYIRRELKDVVEALAPEVGFPATIAVTVRKRHPDKPADKTVNVVVQPTWK